jgi:hypothetical protein
MNSSIGWSEYNQDKYEKPPPRSLNGGWFTGERFKKNSPYGNVALIPDTGYMIHYNLRSANPPPGAIYHYPGHTRIGNNFQNTIGIVTDEIYNISGNEMECGPHKQQCSCRKCSFTKYAYL